MSLRLGFKDGAYRNNLIEFSLMIHFIHWYFKAEMVYCTDDNNCNNGGTCEHFGVCHCSEGYTGNLCESMYTFHKLSHPKKYFTHVSAIIV